MFLSTLCKLTRKFEVILFILELKFSKQWRITVAFLKAAVIIYTWQYAFVILQYVYNYVK